MVLSKALSWREKALKDGLKVGDQEGEEDDEELGWLNLSRFRVTLLLVLRSRRRSSMVDFGREQCYWKDDENKTKKSTIDRK